MGVSWGGEWHGTMPLACPCFPIACCFIHRKVNVTSLETSRFLQSQSEGCGRRGAGDQGRGCSERTRITSAACPMGDLDHRCVQQHAERLSGQNRCARSFKPAPRCHLATRDRCACSSRSQGQADHREGGRMRCSHRAAHLERLAAWRDRGSLPRVPPPVCCAARRVLQWPHSFVSGAVRAVSGGTRVVHDGGVDEIVPDAALWSTDRVVGAAWCSRG